MRKKVNKIQVPLAALTLAMMTTVVAPAQNAEATPGVPVHMVVTVEARHGKDVPTVAGGEVASYEGRTKVDVTDWLPLKGSHAALQLFILLDDTSTSSFGLQLNDIREFIRALPSSTSVGVGYMRDGTVDIVQNLTDQHDAAARSLRLPLSYIGTIANPYISLVDLIKRWPESQVRREVLMISDGIDRFGGGWPDDPYVDEAVEQCERAGVLVHTIYATGIGHYGHTFWRVTWGQNFLSQLAEETGGESYFEGFQTPVSLSPYLEELRQRLEHQYLVTVLAKPERKAGIESIRFKSEVPNAEIVGAEGVYVPATP